MKSPHELSGFYIVFRGSTNLETTGIFGINHFLEHLICKNLKKLQPKFFSQGISWNAYTTLNEVVFYFRGLDSNLSKFKDEIIDIIFDLNINEQDLKKEKGIILEEFPLFFSRPSNNHFYNLTSQHLGSHGPMGTEKDVKNVTLLSILDFYQKHFLEPNLIINVSRNFIFKRDDLSFSTDHVKKKWTFKKQNSPDIYSNTPKDQSSIILYSELLHEQDFAWINFINSLLSASHSSLLFDKLRNEKGLVYDIEANQTLFNQQSLITISTMVSKKNDKKTIDLILETLGNINSLIKVKHIRNLTNHFIFESKIKKIDRYKNINRWIFPENWDVETILKDIDISVLRDKINTYYNPKNFEVSIQSSK